MDNQTFAEVVNDQIQRTTSVLFSKAEEYSKDYDRLHNFKVAAELQGVTPRNAILGMMAKHTVSVYDMGDDAIYTEEYVNEKIGDHINYLILLRAQFEAEFAEQSEELLKLKQKLVGGGSAPGIVIHNKVDPEPPTAHHYVDNDRRLASLNT